MIISMHETSSALVPCLCIVPGEAVMDFSFTQHPSMVRGMNIAADFQDIFFFLDVSFTQSPLIR